MQSLSLDHFQVSGLGSCRNSFIRYIIDYYMGRDEAQQSHRIAFQSAQLVLDPDQIRLMIISHVRIFNDELRGN